MDLQNITNHFTNHLSKSCPQLVESCGNLKAGTCGWPAVPTAPQASPKHSVVPGTDLGSTAVTLKVTWGAYIGTVTWPSMAQSGNTGITSAFSVKGPCRVIEFDWRDDFQQIFRGTSRDCASLLPTNPTSSTASHRAIRLRQVEVQQLSPKLSTFAWAAASRSGIGDSSWASEEVQQFG